MANTTIRISPSSKVALRDLAKKQGKSMLVILDEALETYQRERLLLEANEAYARLRSDPRAWSEELLERKEWEVTLADGQDRE